MVPVFVTGCSRSGTSLMQVLLHGVAGMHGSYTEEYLEDVKPVPGLIVKKPYRVEVHTPDDEIATAVRMGFKVIVMFRDGRDVFTAPHPVYPGQYYLSCAQRFRWVLAVKSHVPFVLSMTNDVLHVRYEDLVKDTARELVRVGAFLRVQFPAHPERALGAIPKGAAVHTAIKGQAQITAAHVGQWREHKPHLAELLQEPKLRQGVCECLRLLNYERDNEWLCELEGVTV